MIRSSQTTTHALRERSGGAINCVYLTSFGAESTSLTTICRYSGIRLIRATDLGDADFLLTVTGATVFLCDVIFADGDWRDALAMAAARHASAAALIVADPVDRPFLAGAHTLWSCGIVWRPFDFIKAIDAVQIANQASRDRIAWLAEISAHGANESAPYRR